MEQPKEIKRVFPMCGKCGSILAQCYCAAARNEIEALGDYMLARTQLGVLELREGECKCGDFHTCDLCREYRDIDAHARQLLTHWGDHWAVRLWSIREEGRLPQYAEVPECQEPEAEPDPGGKGMSSRELKYRFGL